jgi:hypothetical protein
MVNANSETMEGVNTLLSGLIAGKMTLHVLSTLELPLDTDALSD